MKTKLLLSFLLMFTNLLAYSQVNRYTTITPSSYQTTDYSYMLNQAKEQQNRRSSQYSVPSSRAFGQEGCGELIESLKEYVEPVVYRSYSSSVISKVSFYDVHLQDGSYYFAVVCFKSEYSYQCKEYIYMVDSDTKTKYSVSYYSSAGQAFWDYIQPYNMVLECGINL